MREDDVAARAHAVSSALRRAFKTGADGSMQAA
jgi:hypothetical protein